VTDRLLTIEETIEALGISDKTVRRMLKEGILHEQERDSRGRILISPASIAAVAEQLQERRSEKDDTTPPALVLATQAAGFERAIEAFDRVLQDREQAIRERDQEIRRLLEENAELRAERKYLPAPSRVQDLEQENAKLRSELAARSGTMTDQRAKPAPQGWLRRLFSRD
jgi:DNA repair exonuclease SbcCD ATPase subunit